MCDRANRTHLSVKSTDMERKLKELRSYGEQSVKLEKEKKQEMKKCDQTEIPSEATYVMHKNNKEN